MDETDCYGNQVGHIREKRDAERNICKLQRFWRYTRRYQRIAFQRWRAA